MSEIFSFLYSLKCFLPIFKNVLNLGRLAEHGWPVAMATKIDEKTNRVSASVKALTEDPFDSIEKNSVDLYATVRSLYLQDRKKKINNSTGKTEAMDDGDWDTLENK